MKLITSAINTFFFTASVLSTISKAANAEKEVNGEIYWTFDDGPIDASITVMDIMREHGNVKATFFVNGFHLLGEGDENEDLAPQALQQMMDEGHLVANHGINHMLHNCCFDGVCGAKVCNENGIQHATINTYQNVETEYGTFQENTDVCRRFMGVNTTNGDTILPGDALETISRLPYTSTWRVEGLDTDCACCTSDDVNRWDPNFNCTAQNPTQSSLLAGEVADLLQADGHEIYGYDLNWQPENYFAPDVSVTLAGAELTFERIEALAKSTACPNSNNSTHIVQECDPSVHHGKVVILTHEYFFEDNRRGLGTQNIPKFEELLDMLAESGYVSKTLDQYFDNFYPIMEGEDEQSTADEPEEAAPSGDADMETMEDTEDESMDSEASGAIRVAAVASSVLGAIVCSLLF